MERERGEIFLWAHYELSWQWKLCWLKRQILNNSQQSTQNCGVASSSTSVFGVQRLRRFHLMLMALFQLWSHKLFVGRIDPLMWYFPRSTSALYGSQARETRILHSRPFSRCMFQEQNSKSVGDIRNQPLKLLQEQAAKQRKRKKESYNTSKRCEKKKEKKRELQYAQILLRGLHSHTIMWYYIVAVYMYQD